MRLKSEIQILDPGIRKKIIEEINGSENQRRKDEAYKRWKTYRDQTDMFVIQLLLLQFSQETVREMSYAMTNISLVRKVIDKLARVYSSGSSREIIDEMGRVNEQATEVLDELSDKLDFESKMKMVNRILKLQRNAICYLKPCPFINAEGEERMKVRVSPMNPYLYDVVEEFYDRTKPMAYIFSNYEQQGFNFTTQDPATVRFIGSLFNPNNQQAGGLDTKQGDGKDQLLADKKEDEDSRAGKDKEYIWWTDNFHFTTDGGGTIIDANFNELKIEGVDDEQIQNPIGMMPIVNFAIDQENSFWAEGGSDLINGGILLNTLMTNLNHIAVVQGYGQFFMTGKQLPRNVEVGPSKSVILEYEDGEPKPEIGFANASPPLSELQASIESQVALTLTTNNLSTSGVSTQLGGGTAFPSGIAMMIDKAESMEDVSDQQMLFVDNEKKIWTIINRWLQVFNEDNNVDDDVSGLLLPENFDMKVAFNDPPSIASESEKLNNLKVRKELGINTMIDLIRKDDPNLSEDEARMKLEKIEQEKMDRMQSVNNGMMQNRNDDSEDVDSDVSEGEQGNGGVEQDDE